ncbi:UPF0378 protein KIAA0100like, partial [Caligus rogercresseyi]
AEIFFSRAQWRLTENDGQLGVLDASISNFFYTKTLMPDDTTEHSLEMGYIYLKNLLPNQKYEDVLYPTELQRDAPLTAIPRYESFVGKGPHHALLLPGEARVRRPGEAALIQEEEQGPQDDIEMMKDRAQQNKLFVYIKIPEVPICVSYKGEKEKNRISDLTNFVLHVPNIEYHNVTWTWLDLFLAIKSQCKESLISQLIKEKLKLPQRVGSG